MELYLTRDGETHGPYDLPSVRQMLATGAVQRSELGWTEAAGEWKPIGDLLPPPKRAEIVSKGGFGKRIVGAIFLLLGAGIVWGLLQPETPRNPWIGWLTAIYCLAGGSWWVAGKGEPYPVPLRARLALIFALFLATFASLLFTVINALPQELAQVPEAQKFTFYAKAGVLVLFGLPTVILGHSGRNAIARDARLRGNGRCVLALLLGYLWIVLLAISTYGYVSERSESAAPVVIEEPAVPVEPAKAVAPPPTPKGFYIKDRVSVKTDSGIRGFSPGSPIRILEDRGDLVLVEADGFQFEVRRDQILTSYE